MSDAVNEGFDEIYGTQGFYYGLEPSEELAEFITGGVPVGAALDLGCGEGRDAILLAEKGFSVTAVDASQAGLKKLAEYAATHGLDISCVKSDVRTFAFPTERYILVNAVTILDHLQPDEIAQVAAGIKRSVCPGGYVFVEVFTTADPGAQSDVCAPVSETSGYVAHYFSSGELRALFRGFDVLRYEEKLEEDTSHGEPHHHGVAILLCRQRVDAQEEDE